MWTSLSGIEDTIITNTYSIITKNKLLHLYIDDDKQNLLSLIINNTYIRSLRKYMIASKY